MKITEEQTDAIISLVYRKINGILWAYHEEEIGKEEAIYLIGEQYRKAMELEINGITN